jgi:hypothetical protein
MAVTPNDLVAFASAGMPEDDTATSGGAIDADTRVVFTQLRSDGTLTVVSTAAGDTTQQVTVEARDPTDAVVQQTVTLTGTTPVNLNTLGTVSRVLQVTLNADAAGSVSVNTAYIGGGTDVIGTIPPGERGFLCFHREGSASVGSQQDFYYKVFFKNTHATDSLAGGSVSESSDSQARMTFALAATINDSGSVANRKTAPAALTFDNSAKAIPGTLAPGNAIGVWIKASHPAGDVDASLTYGLSISGV